MAEFRHGWGTPSGVYCSRHCFFPSGRSFEWAGYLETIRKEAILFVFMIYLILAEKGYGIHTELILKVNFALLQEIWTSGVP